jgi:hypothetical protein
MECPHCESKDTSKAIAWAMPVKLCLACNCLWGEPFASIYCYLIAPVEALFNDGFSFQLYRGSYWIALWHWLFLKRK